MEKERRNTELPYIRVLTILAIVWLLIGLVGLLYWLLSMIGNIIFLLLLGIVVAAGLSSVADFSQKRFSILPRWAIIILIYLALLLVIILVGLIVGIPLVGQIRQLIDNYPKLAGGINQRFSGLQKLLFSVGIKLPNLSNAAGKLTDLIQNYGQSVFKGFLSFVLVFSSGISQFIVITVISFYILLEQYSIADSMLAAFPKKYQDDVRSLSREIKTIISSFIGGQLLVALIMGFTAAIFAVILGIPYSALIGVFVAVTGLIPIIGSFLGAIPPVIIAYSVAPWKAIVFIIFFAALSQFVSYYLQPRIVGQAIGLNPLTILIALLVGLEIAGFWGAILSAPILSIFFVLVKYLFNWYKEYSESLAG